MLFMLALEFEPGMGSKLIEKRAQGKPPRPAGKVVGHWAAIAQGKSFMVLDSDDPHAMAELAMLVGDFGKLDIIPILPVGDFDKVAAGRK